MDLDAKLVARFAETRDYCEISEHLPFDAFSGRYDFSRKDKAHFRSKVDVHRETFAKEFADLSADELELYCAEFERVRKARKWEFYRR